MKVSDFIFQYTANGNSCLCRVRTFAASGDQLYVVLTEIEGVHLYGSITNYTEEIHKQLRVAGYVPEAHCTIEHYEPGTWRTARFDLVTFNESGSPEWKEVERREVERLLKCSRDEFTTNTSDIPHLFQRVESLTYEIAPFLGIERYESPAKTARRLEIEDAKKPKSELIELINGGAGERELQRYLKLDLTLISELYAQPRDEYICFAEYPLGNGFVDFAVFTGRIANGCHSSRGERSRIQCDYFWKLPKFLA